MGPTSLTSMVTFTCKLPRQPHLLIEGLTSVNLSGIACAQKTSFYEIIKNSNLYVIEKPSLTSQENLSIYQFDAANVMLDRVAAPSSDASEVIFFLSSRGWLLEVPSRSVDASI